MTIGHRVAGIRQRVDARIVQLLEHRVQAIALGLRRPALLRLLLGLPLAADRGKQHRFVAFVFQNLFEHLFAELCLRVETGPDPLPDRIEHIRIGLVHARSCWTPGTCLARTVTGRCFGLGNAE
nr:hypothetical protein [Xanthomonas translucens]